MRALAALLVGPVISLCSCAATAGMSCQQDDDCRVGLVCSRPKAAAGSFGVCEPARRGLGETCLWSSECQAPLFCSNEIGRFTADQRHGTCQPRPDAGTHPADASPDMPDMPDMSPVDAATGDGLDGGG